jgi:hypothetical protein
LRAQQFMCCAPALHTTVASLDSGGCALLLRHPLVLEAARFAALHRLNSCSCAALLCELALSHPPTLSCLNRARCVILVLQFATRNASALSRLDAQRCYLLRDTTISTSGY